MITPIKKQALSAVILSMALAACNESTTSTEGADFNKNKDTTGDFNQSEMVAAITDNIITPTYQAFEEQSDIQSDAVAAYCEAEKLVSQQPNNREQADAALLNAQDKWRDAMNAWQQVEMMQMGPLLEQDGLLRNKIYSWPIVNTCAVDFDVTYYASGTVNGEPYDITKRTPTRKGMAALEYLIFSNNLGHSCTGTSIPPGWDDLMEHEQREARCEFATEVSSDINNNAQTLVSSWLADGGYASKLKQAGEENSIFESPHDAVNAISDAMFYLDSSTKDGKIATPAGILTNACGLTPCPEVVESKYSSHSLSNITYNLVAFEMLLTGGSGLGFTDYLLDEGDSLTVEAMTGAVTKAKDNIQSKESSLQELLVNDASQVNAIHADVKEVTDKLKVDFINSLALKLPSTSAGDND